ncbi:MAG: archease [Armatimonadetes bacterium]|nr:archease [Armatimonadota bacterium]
MGTFEVIEHTADIGIIARGATLVEVFEAAAEGMFSLMVDPGTVENRAWLEREVEAEDHEGLLVDWLNNLLAVVNIEAFVPVAFVVEQVSPSRLRATVHGEPVDPNRHRFRRDIKAATYHMVEVRQADVGWTARVIFDV